MAEVKLNGTIQESVLTLLVHNEVHGKIAASMVTPEFFEGDYKVVAAAALEYWKRYKMPAGPHIDDELGHIISDPKNRRAPTFRRIIGSMLRLSESMNPPYILGRVNNFMRMQELKGAILDSAKQLDKPQGDLAVEDIERVFGELIRKRKQGFEPGVRLTQYDKFLAHVEAGDEFVTGIPQLDARHCTPARGTAMLFLGAAGKGKSWFLINVGRKNLALRKKVLHITLEMSDMICMQRYYQAIFSASKRALAADAELLQHAVLDIDDEHKLVGINFEDTEPAFSLDAATTRLELEARIIPYEARYQNLIIKRFPPRRLDGPMLRSYLDQLELVEGFIPDMVILDYIGITKTDPKNPRTSLGIMFEEFRAIMIERDMAGVTAHQLSKEGAEAIQASGLNVAEDWSMIGTADIVVTYSVTDWEANFGVGRLQASKIRDEADRYTLLLTQNYNIGQFCIESHPLRTDYWDLPLVKQARSRARRIVGGKGDDEEEQANGLSRYERKVG